MPLHNTPKAVKTIHHRHSSSQQPRAPHAHPTGPDNITPNTTKLPKYTLTLTTALHGGRADYGYGYEGHETHLQVQCPHSVVRGQCISDCFHARLTKAVLPKVELRERIVLPERPCQLDSAAGSDLNDQDDGTNGPSKSSGYDRNRARGTTLITSDKHEHRYRMTTEYCRDIKPSPTRVHGNTIVQRPISYTGGSHENTNSTREWWEGASAKENHRHHHHPPEKMLKNSNDPLPSLIHN